MPYETPEFNEDHIVARFGLPSIRNLLGDLPDGLQPENQHQQIVQDMIELAAEIRTQEARFISALTTITEEANALRELVERGTRDIPHRMQELGQMSVEAETFRATLATSYATMRRYAGLYRRSATGPDAHTTDTARAEEQVWVLTYDAPEGHAGYDETREVMVIAEGEADARRAAAELAGDEGRGVWMDDYCTRARAIGCAYNNVDHGITVRDFLAG